MTSLQSLLSLSKRCLRDNANLGESLTRLAQSGTKMPKPLHGMKKIDPLRPLRHRYHYPILAWSRQWSLLLLLPLAMHSSEAARLKEARVTQVVKDVKLLPGQAAPRPAQVRDEVRDGTAVRTGVESRAELTFTDQTLARLGANSIFKSQLLLSPLPSLARLFCSSIIPTPFASSSSWKAPGASFATIAWANRFWCTPVRC
jgi:hypothetical protein